MKDKDTRAPARTHTGTQVFVERGVYVSVAIQHLATRGHRGGINAVKLHCAADGAFKRVKNYIYFHRALSNLRLHTQQKWLIDLLTLCFDIS